MKNLFYEKKFLYTFISCVVCVLPLLFYNLYYNDDYARAVWGYSGWKADGRPVADIISRIFNFSFYGKPYSLSDTHPLPLLLGLLIFSISTDIFCRQYLKNKPIFVYIAFSIVVINGFSIENLAYRFDSLTMLFAMSTAIVSVSALGYNNFKNYILCSVLSLTLSLNSYQGAINLYFTMSMLGFILLCHDGCDSKKIYFFLFRIIITALISLALYMITGYKFVNNSHIESSIGNSGFSLNSVLDKINLYFDAVKNGFSINEVVVFFPFVLFFLVLIVTMIYSYFKRKKIVISFALMLYPFLLFLTVPGVFLIIQHTELSHKAMMSLGGIELIIVIMCGVIVSKVGWLTYLCLLPLAMNMVSAYAYYNASYSQKEYTDFYIMKIAGDIDDISNGDAINNIYIKGGVPNSPEMNIMSAKHPALAGMALSLNEYSSWILPSVFKKFGLEYSIFSFENFSRKKDLCSNAVYKKGIAYVIYKINDNIVVDFDKNLCK